MCGLLHGRLVIDMTLDREVQGAQQNRNAAPRYERNLMRIICAGAWRRQFRTLWLPRKASAAAEHCCAIVSRNHASCAPAADTLPRGAFRANACVTLGRNGTPDSARDRGLQARQGKKRYAGRRTRYMGRKTRYMGRPEIFAEQYGRKTRYAGRGNALHGAEKALQRPRFVAALAKRSHKRIVSRSQVVRLISEN